MNVSLFGMEIFVERCPDDAVSVDGDTELAGYLRHICVVFSIASLVREDHQIASVFNIPLQILDLSGSEGIFGSSEDEKVSFFDLLEIDSVLVESNFVTFLVLFDKLFKVRARVANFLLAGVEYDHFLGRHV